MALFRLVINSLAPEIFEVVDREFEDEGRGRDWARKKYKVSEECIAATELNPDEAMSLAELETRVGGKFTEPFLQVDQSRIVGLDLGCPLETFGGFTDEQIAPLGRLTNLRSLSLRGDLTISDAGLAFLERLKNLRELILDEMQIGDDALQHIKGLAKIETLYLGKSTLKANKIKQLRQITDLGLDGLADLRRLKHLSLDCSKITGEPLSQFADLSNFSYLMAENTDFNDRAMKNIAKMPNLEYLQLSHTKMTDSGLCHLSELRKIRELYLDGNNLSDRGLKWLRPLKSLNYVGLKRTHVTKTGLEDLQQRLPNLAR